MLVLLLLLVQGLCGMCGSTAVIASHTSISKVMVHRAGAVVTRSAHVDLPQGVSVVVLPGLPSSVTSVQAITSTGELKDVRVHVDRLSVRKKYGLLDVIPLTLPVGEEVVLEDATGTQECPAELVGKRGTVMGVSEADGEEEVVLSVQGQVARCPSYLVTKVSKGVITELTREAEQELEELRAEQANLTAKLRSAKGRVEMWTAERVRMTGLNITTGDALLALLDIYHKMHAEYDAAVRQEADLQEREKVVRERIRQGKKNLEVLSRRPSGDTSIAVLVVDVPHPTNQVLVEVAYQPRGAASWKPVYQARLRDDTLAITYLARVKQATAENWRDTKIVVTSTDPSAHVAPPSLSVWKMYAADGECHRSYGYGSYGGSPTRPQHPTPPAATQAEQAEEMAPKVLSDEGHMKIVSQSGAFVFEPPTRQTIDVGDTVDVPLLTFAVPAGTTRLLAVPKLTPKVFNVLTIATHTTTPTLLPGPLSVYLGDGVLMAETKISSPVPSGASFDIPLNIDRRLRVISSREAVHEKDGIISSSSSGATYRYVAENKGHGKATVTVVDNIPVFEETAVTVSMASSIAPHRTDKATGKVEWDISVGPGDEKSWTLNYSIQYPTSWSISDKPCKA